MHNASKVLMGSTKSNRRMVDSLAGEIEAGKVVRLKDDGTLSLAKADGSALGVSLGKDLGNAKHTAVCRAGLKVPVLLTNGFSPAIGDQVFISDTTGLAIATGAGATGVNAIYVSEALTAVKEDGTEVASGCAYIDFQGGL